MQNLWYASKFNRCNIISRFAKGGYETPRLTSIKLEQSVPYAHMNASSDREVAVESFPLTRRNLSLPIKKINYAVKLGVVPLYQHD